MRLFKSQSKAKSIPELTSSILYDESTFYKQFISDLKGARQEVIIESPFLTIFRVRNMKSIFQNLISKGIKVYIFTKDPSEHELNMREQSEVAIRFFEELGIQVYLIKGGHHRKLAIIDRNISWEGSLNILSQYQSREIMRRIESKKMAQDLFCFLNYQNIKELSNFDIIHN